MWRTAVSNLKIKQPKKSTGTSSKVTAMGLVSVRPYNEGVRKNARSTWRRNVRRVGATKGPSGMVVAWCFFWKIWTFDFQPEFQWLYDLKPRSIIRPMIEVGEWWPWHLLVPLTAGRPRYMSIFRMSQTSKIPNSSSTFKLIYSIYFLQPVFFVSPSSPQTTMKKQRPAAAGSVGVLRPRRVEIERPLLRRPWLQRLNVVDRELILGLFEKRSGFPIFSKG